MGQHRQYQCKHTAKQGPGHRKLKSHLWTNWEWRQGKGDRHWWQQGWWWWWQPIWRWQWQWQHGKRQQHRLAGSWKCTAVYRESTHVPTQKIAGKLTSVIKTTHQMDRTSVQTHQMVTWMWMNQIRTCKSQTSMKRWKDSPGTWKCHVATWKQPEMLV